MMLVLLLELGIIAYTIALWSLMRAKKYSKPTLKLFILFIAVLLFEVMSEPMWLNLGFHSWAYIYRDITWIITLGWVNIFMTSFMIVDYFYGKIHEVKRFWMYIFLIQFITIPIELLLLQSGFREYAPFLTQTMTGHLIPFTVVPIEAVLAIPLFTSLIVCFYKYATYIWVHGEKNVRKK